MTLPNREVRIELNTRIVMSFIGNAGFIGNTLDISESGVMIITGYKPPGIRIGAIGIFKILHVEIGQKKQSAKVVRITDQGVAISFLSS